MAVRSGVPPSAERPPVPAVLVSGLPGSGKSVLGAALAARLGAALLDQDTLTAPLVAVVLELLGEDHIDGARAAALTRSPRYEALLATAEDCLRCRTPVVLVAPFSRERRDPSAWLEVRERLQVAGGRPRLVWVDAPPEVLRRRLAGRGAARDVLKVADLDGFVRTADWLPPAVEHLRVDTDALDPEAALDAVCTLLDLPPA